jgi:PAS domain S-box-containing protein
MVVRDSMASRRRRTPSSRPTLDYRTLIEHAVEGVFRTTPDGRFLMANRALARMLGYDTPEQLIAERVDLVHRHYVRPEERARFRRVLEAQGVVQGFEYEAYRRDGTTIWLRDHARVVYEPDGTLYYEGTVEDITNRRRAEQLLDLRARQQAAVARLGETALSRPDLDALLDCAMSLVTDTLAVEFGQVLEALPDGNLLLRAGIGWAGDLIGSTIPGGQRSQAGRTIASQQPIVIDDWRRDDASSTPEHFRKHGVVSGVTVIIGPVARPYGVLGAHTRVARTFSIDDVNFLQGIASILAAAIVRRRGDEVRGHLLARALSAHEEERTRIARELHDETGQALSAVLLGLKSLEHADTVDQARAQAHRLRDLTAQTVRDVGRIARGLRPSTLDDLGLFPALQRYGEELGASHDLEVRISSDGPARFPADVETTLYRIVQEALTNVARHARARAANVTIRSTNGSVQVTVRDDGAGFDVDSELEGAASRRGLGLIGMRERASLLGGSLVISSRRGEGTCIAVELPVNGAP